MLLILITFAVAGSATGYVGKLLMSYLHIRIVWLYIIIYVLAITLIWPLMVITMSMIFGQYPFFRSYLGRMRQRIFNRKQLNNSAVVHPKEPHPGTRQQIRLAIFASGGGTNAEKIIDHFRQHPFVRVVLMVSNKPASRAVGIAVKENIPVLIIEKEKFFRDNAYVDELKQLDIDLIVLAGFLWKLPTRLVLAWHRRIINIHPALLPKYGGKGLYGHHVHEAVIQAGEKESGITIHYVDDIYDHGEKIFQEKVIIEEGDTPELLARKIQALEHLHFPRIIEEVIRSIWRDEDRVVEG